MQRFCLAYRSGFHYTSLRDLWGAYCRELYRMDQHYRSFCCMYDQALALGAMALEDALKAAADMAECMYKNSYLDEINRTWTQLFAQQGLQELAALPSSGTSTAIKSPRRTAAYTLSFPTACATRPPSLCPRS